MTDKQTSLPEAPYVVGVGAANVDSHWQSLNPVNLRDSNPCHSMLSVGGVTRNICENLARLGTRVSLLSAVGDDAYAEMIVKTSESVGIDMSHVEHKKNTVSSSYVAVLDEKGDMLLGLSDMRIINNMPVEYLEQNAALIRGAAAVVCDGALPREVMIRLTELASGPCFIDPVSIAYAKNAAPVINRFDFIKPNSYELEILSGMKIENDADLEKAAAVLLDRGTGAVAVSLGARGCYYADRTGLKTYRAIQPLEMMADATGAGDAFTAGLIYGKVNGFDTERMLRTALAAGRIAAASPLTVSPEMSEHNIARTLEEYGQDPGPGNHEGK